MTDADIVNLCENIKILRFARELSEASMAEICGISVDELRQLELGILPENTSVDLVIRLNLYFGISPEKLFEPAMRKPKSFYS